MEYIETNTELNIWSIIINMNGTIKGYLRTIDSILLN